MEAPTSTGKASKNTGIIAILVVLVVVVGVVAFFLGSYTSSHAVKTSSNGVRFVNSQVSCVPASQGLAIEAGFEIANTSPQDVSVQVELVAGSQILTQSTYALAAAGSDNDYATGSISWNVVSCPSDVSLQLG